MLPAARVSTFNTLYGVAHRICVIIVTITAAGSQAFRQVHGNGVVEFVAAGLAAAAGSGQYSTKGNHDYYHCLYMATAASSTCSSG